MQSPTCVSCDNPMRGLISLSSLVVLFRPEPDEIRPDETSHTTGTGHNLDTPAIVSRRNETA